jgi:hypothetical protein
MLGPSTSSDGRQRLALTPHSAPSSSVEAVGGQRAEATPSRARLESSSSPALLQLLDHFRSHSILPASRGRTTRRSATAKEDIVQLQDLELRDDLMHRKRGRARNSARTRTPFGYFPPACSHVLFCNCAHSDEQSLAISEAGDGHLQRVLPHTSPEDKR